MVIYKFFTLNIIIHKILQTNTLDAPGSSIFRMHVYGTHVQPKSWPRLLACTVHTHSKTIHKTYSSVSMSMILCTSKCAWLKACILASVHTHYMYFHASKSIHVCVRVIMRVCVYMCVKAHVFVCIVCVCVCACKHICMWPCACVCECLCMYVGVCIHVVACVCIMYLCTCPSMCACMHACICVCMYMRACMHAWRHVYICVCMPLCMWVCVCDHSNTSTQYIHSILYIKQVDEFLW
jgi:hypothetical protein